MSLSGGASGAIPKTPDPEEGNEDLPNQISAAYEVPQFPIEQIEKKLMLQRHLTAKWVHFHLISVTHKQHRASSDTRHDTKSLLRFINFAKSRWIKILLLAVGNCRLIFAHATKFLCLNRSRNKSFPSQLCDWQSEWLSLFAGRCASLTVENEIKILWNSIDYTWNTNVEKNRKWIVKNLLAKNLI